MAPLDSAEILPDIDSAQPAGENLEFDPAFAELERLAAGKPEQQYGATVVPAEDPDWREVVAAATALMARTYDLRVMVQLAVARLHLGGVEAYAATLEQVRHVLETRWDAVHPQLDPEDDNDPTLRANALLTATEPVRVLRFLRNLPLARSARAGTVSWRDISIATGSLDSPADTAKLTDAAIGAAFRETDPAALAGLRAAVASALASATAIPAVFDGRSGHGTGPRYDDLLRLLREIGQMMDAHTPRKAAEPEPEPEPETADGTAPPAAAARSATAVSIATLGPPTNRADALRLLDLVLDYYARYEPSSPLPLLIARARRLADMGFMEILRDMAPDGISQAERIAGTADT